MKKRYLVFIGLLIFTSFIGLCQSSVSQRRNRASSLPEKVSQSKESVSQRQNSVGVKELYDEFKTDVSTVSGKYRNKSVTSTGVVVKKGPDMHGTPSVELSDVAGGKPYVIYVVNSFSQLDEIKIGETVTMQGIFHIFGSDDWVVMKRGVVVPTN